MATSTWEARRRALRDLRLGSTRPTEEEFLRAVDKNLRNRNNLDPTTRIKDLSAYQFWATRLVTANTLCIAAMKDASAGLRRMKAVQGPPSQALPVTPGILRSLLNRCGVPTSSPTLRYLAQIDDTIVTHKDDPTPIPPFPNNSDEPTWPRVALLFLVAFRTASRMGDLQLLRSDDLSLTARGLVIRFGITKSNPVADPRIDHQVLVRCPGPLVQLILLRGPLRG